MFTRVPPEYRETSDRRRPLAIIGAVLVGLYLLLTSAGSFWTDYLWFESVGYENVWQRRLGMSLLLGAIGLGFTFAVLWLNLKLVDRFSPSWVPFDLSQEEELAERFREWIEPRVRQVRIWVMVAFSLILGLTMVSWRDQVFMFFNSQSVGVDDPIFDTDVGFYIFRLPLLDSVTDWLFNLLVVSLIVVVVAYYVSGGIRFDGRRFTVTRPAKTHVSILLAVIALIRAVIYRLDTYELVLSDRASGFFGPGYTDINARLPALRLLLFIAIAAAIIFAANIFRKGWTLAVVAIGSWLVVSIGALAIYPAIVQRFQVTPAALERETPYIENNLEFTRMAWGLDGVEVRDFAATDALSADDIEENRLTIDNLRLWNTSVLPRTYQNFQELRPYYTLGVVDTDRYPNAANEPTQMMLAVRELEEEDLPRTDWQNEMLFYTHGVGAGVNEANVVGSGGQPEFLLKDVPPTAVIDSLDLIEPRIYFGETYRPGRPVIVKTGASPQEIDYPVPGQENAQRNEYQGEAGVELSSIWRRAAFAFRYRDLNILISSEVRGDSRVLVERNIKEMVDEVAPFLEVDADPYPVIMDGRVTWVLDLYTTTDHYPYSQPLTNQAIGRLAQSSGLRGGVNYMRNSVKAVVDAHDGGITFYLFDESDPIIQAWSDVYPGVFIPADQMPAGLADHLRYPQDLFRVQGQLYLEYHVNAPTELFTGNDAWSLPADPSTISRNNAVGQELLFGDQISATAGSVRYRAEILPYYLLTRLPGEEDLSYLLLQPFTPREKRNMAGFLVADSTPGRYGRLVDFRMPQGELVDGTEQVGQRIEQDADIAEQLSLWRGRGSDVIKGDLLVIPIEDSLIYIQPIFLEEEGGSFPEFRRVAVVFGDQVEWAETLDGALGLIFGDGEGEEPPEPPGDPGTQSVEELLNQAADAFAAAEIALRAGDLAEYQRQVEEAERLTQEALDILTGAVSAKLGALG
jgi:uncharacterized membrane protein (UPF0182 family)